MQRHDHHYARVSGVAAPHRNPREREAIMNSYKHAQTAAHEFGGNPLDYLPIEEFIDSSKQHIGDVRHRSMYHHTAGIWLCQTIFGPVIDVPGKVPGNTIQVPVRLIAEKHVLEDLGWLPGPQDYINNMDVRPWMGGPVRRTLSRKALHLNTPESTETTGVTA